MNKPERDKIVNLIEVKQALADKYTRRAESCPRQTNRRRTNRHKARKYNQQVFDLKAKLQVAT